MRLGEYLVRQGLISVEQLEAALRAQVMYGARLGTNLIEQGTIVDLDVLAQALAALHGVPPALKKHLEHVDRVAVQMVPAKLAAKHAAVPLGFTRSTPRRLAVAFIDPNVAHAAHEIGMLTGHTVLPSVACELRVHYYLERIYGIARHNRFVRVEDAAARHREAHERRRFVEAFPSINLTDEPPKPAAAAAPPEPEPPPPPAPAPAPYVVRPGPASSHAMSGSWDIPLPPPRTTGAVSAVAPPAPVASPAPVGSPAPVAPPAPVAVAPVVAPPPTPPMPLPFVPAPPPSERPPIGASAAIAMITGATDRDVIGDLLVDHLRAGFGGGIVFIVRQSMALGWKGSAPGVEDAVIEAIALPLTQPSMLKPVADGGGGYHGAPPTEGAVLNGLLWKILKVTAPPPEVVVAPISIGPRVVNLVYAHATDHEPLAPEAVADLTKVCAAASAAFLRLIQAAKAAPKP